jgi:hypothetical protein
LNEYLDAACGSPGPKQKFSQERIRFFAPRVVKHLPDTSSISAALAFCPNTLHQLRQICIQKKTYVTSDYLDKYVISICVSLNVPFLGTSMDAMRDYFTQPGGDIKLLRDAGIETKRHVWSVKANSSLGTVAKECKRIDPTCKVWMISPFRKPGELYYRNLLCRPFYMMCTLTNMQRLSYFLSFWL